MKEELKKKITEGKIEYARPKWTKVSDVCRKAYTWMDFTLDQYEYEKIDLTAREGRQTNISQQFFGELVQRALYKMQELHSKDISAYYPEIDRNSRVSTVGTVYQDEYPDENTWNEITKSAEICYDYLEGYTFQNGIGHKIMDVEMDTEPWYVEAILDGYTPENNGTVVELKCEKKRKAHEKRNRRQVILYCIMNRAENGIIINPVNSTLCICRNVYSTWLRVEKKEWKSWTHENIKKSKYVYAPECPYALELASSDGDPACDDEEYVIECLKNNAEGLEFASERIRSDRDFLFFAFSVIDHYPTLCREFDKEDLLQKSPLLNDYGFVSDLAFAYDRGVWITPLGDLRPIRDYSGYVPKEFLDRLEVDHPSYFIGKEAEESSYFLSLPRLMAGIQRGKRLVREGQEKLAVTEEQALAEARERKKEARKAVEKSKKCIEEWSKKENLLNGDNGGFIDIEKRQIARNQAILDQTEEEILEQLRSGKAQIAEKILKAKERIKLLEGLLAELNGRKIPVQSDGVVAEQMNGIAVVDGHIYPKEYVVYAIKGLHEKIEQEDAKIVKEQEEIKKIEARYKPNSRSKIRKEDIEKCQEYITWAEERKRNCEEMLTKMESIAEKIKTGQGINMTEL